MLTLEMYKFDRSWRYAEYQFAHANLLEATRDTSTKKF